MQPLECTSGEARAASGGAGSGTTGDGVMHVQEVCVRQRLHQWHAGQNWLTQPSGAVIPNHSVAFAFAIRQTHIQRSLGSRPELRVV